jgi:hypothetical protein
LADSTYDLLFDYDAMRATYIAQRETIAAYQRGQSWRDVYKQWSSDGMKFVPITYDEPAEPKPRRALALGGLR